MRGINIQLSDEEHRKIEELKVKFKMRNKAEVLRKIIRDFEIKEK